MLCLALFAADKPQAEVRDSEVWLVQAGHERQLTHDGKSKIEAALSPAEDRIVYYEACPQAEHCSPTAIVLDLTGKKIASFQPKSEGQPCPSILAIAWVSEQAISTECHINPSLSEYIVTDVATGRVVRDLLGYDFTPSPDGSRVAHVGWIPHFTDPPAHSNYLQVDNTTIYPLEAGTTPHEDKEPTAPQVVRQDAHTFRGIHEFMPGLSWSPDSRRVALIDCVYDWTGSDSQAGPGQESERTCAVIVADLDGKFSRVALDNPWRDLYQAQLAWEGPHRIMLAASGTTKTIDVP
jgi:hypothetical protein